jgi:hypothetical protein
MLEAQIPVAGWKGGDGDAAYLDKMLRHQLIELSLDESVSGIVLRRFWGRAAGVASIWFVFFFILALFNGLGSGSSGLYGESSGDNGSTVMGIAVLGSFVIFWFVFLFSRMQEPIGEWRVLLADRAPAKAAVYSQIHGRLRDRNLPIAYSARRIRTGMGRNDVGDRVILEDGHYFAYISVFEYGTSLYLGWMMWRNRRGTALIARFFSDMVAGVLGRLDPVRLMLRTERPRAMREAVHSVCREGLHVAVEGLEVPESYGFPSGLPPVEEGLLVEGVAPRSVPVAAMPVPAAPVPPASMQTVPDARQWEQEPDWSQPPPAPVYQDPLSQSQSQPQYQEQQPQPQYQEQQYREQQYQEAQYREQLPPPAPLPAPGFFQRPESGSQEPYVEYQQQQQQLQQQWGQEQNWREQ